MFVGLIGTQLGDEGKFFLHILSLLRCRINDRTDDPILFGTRGRLELTGYFCLYLDIP